MYPNFVNKNVMLVVFVVLFVVASFFFYISLIFKLEYSICAIASNSSVCRFHAYSSPIPFQVPLFQIQRPYGLERRESTV